MSSSDDLGASSANLTEGETAVVTIPLAGCEEAAIAKIQENPLRAKVVPSYVASIQGNALVDNGIDPNGVFSVVLVSGGTKRNLGELEAIGGELEFPITPAEWQTASVTLDVSSAVEDRAKWQAGNRLAGDYQVIVLAAGWFSMDGVAARCPIR